jgi:diguanylate cyclase (GGDEF)-like protein/PAS domain S-box-containing protein
MASRQRSQVSAGSSRQWHPFPPGEDPYRALFEHVADFAVLLLDPQGIVRGWNAAAEAIDGYMAEEMIGQSFAMLYPPAEVARGVHEAALAAAGRLGTSTVEGWRVRKDGLRYWSRTSTTALRDADGRIYGYGQIVRDLTRDKTREDALRRSEERTHLLRDQAMRDPLTGAFNRRHLEEFLRRVVDRPEQRAASLLAVDVDRFKAINDRHGHAIGDSVLVGIARLADRQLRDCDKLFRVGGDEFLVYVPGVSAEDARLVAERLRDAVQQSRLVGDLPVTVSIGIAQLRLEDSVETWIENADAAMYAAKGAGRNRVM